MINRKVDSQSSSSNSNDWFVCPQPNPRVETRLFFFPYAGGGPAVFSKWCRELPDDIEAWIAHYPGRGSRHKELLIKELPSLVERIHRAIESLLDKPFAFFGHSLGGLLAFELSRQLRRHHLAQPQTLFISACGAPHLHDPSPPLHVLPDTEFLEALQKLNGIPPELLNQPDLLQLILPILRADFEVIENFQYTPEAPLGCPMIAFGGLDDSRVSRERLEGWAVHTVASFKSEYFPGDHFFINNARESVIASVTAALTSSHAKN